MLYKLKSLYISLFNRRLACEVYVALNKRRGLMSANGADSRRNYVLNALGGAGDSMNDRATKKL